MKKNTLTYIVGCMLLVFTACTAEEDTLLKTPTTSASFTTASNTNGGCEVAIIPNQLVVKFAPHTYPRQKIALRDSLGVVSIRTCTCADPTLELWIFEDDSAGNPIDLEEAKAIAQADPGLQGVDFNFSFAGGTANYQIAEPPLAALDHRNLITKDIGGVGIAILDAGLQFDHPDFDDKFLYNSAANGAACMGELSGWDFVNGDPTPYDDNGHGTIVTHLISQTLENQNISHQILPVKVFDKNGKGTYFDILCGYRFADSKPGIDIINMSFGWCGAPDSLLQVFINETEQKRQTLLVTSAGNEGADNDALSHYPSSYPNKNLLSIAAMNEDLTALANFSNFGVNSVDFAGVGEKIEFDFGSGSTTFSGTSFAAAYVSAHVARLLSEGVPIDQIEGELLNESIPLNTLSNIKHSAFLENQ